MINIAIIIARNKKNHIYIINLEFRSAKDFNIYIIITMPISIPPPIKLNIKKIIIKIKNKKKNKNKTKNKNKNTNNNDNNINTHNNNNNIPYWTRITIWIGMIPAGPQSRALDRNITRRISITKNF